MLLHEHKNQWKNNEKLLNWLQSQKCTYFDWLIIITFYTVLHKMDELIHQKFPGYDKRNETRKNTGHAYRNKMVGKYYKSVHSEYDSLYRKSRKVRYEQRKLNKIKTKDLKKYIDIWVNTIKPLKPYPTS